MEFYNLVLWFSVTKRCKSCDFTTKWRSWWFKSKNGRSYFHFWKQDEVLFLVDLWSGTPFNQANLLLNGHEDHWAIVTGLNLPMLIEAYAMRMSTDSAPEIATHICEVARDGVNIRPEELEP